MGQLLVSVAQIIVAVILAAIASYLGILLFNRATRDLDEWAELRRGNTAMGLVLGSIILGIALILRPALTVPVMADTGTKLYPVLALFIQVAAILLGLVLALSAIIFAVGLFDRLTGQIDELAELQQGNVAVAAVMVGVILAVSLLMSRAIEQIITWFVAFVSSHVQGNRADYHLVRGFRFQRVSKDWAQPGPKPCLINQPDSPDCVADIFRPIRQPGCRPLQFLQAAHGPSQPCLRAPTP